MKLLPAYTSTRPLARPSQRHKGVYGKLLVCTTCGFEEDRDQFIDGRNYSIVGDDTYDCPCCGMTTVVESQYKQKWIPLPELPKTWFPKTIAECEMER